MRLARVQHGHAFKERLILWLMGLTSRKPAPDVVRAIFYRPELFGRQYSPMLQEVMRGESAWSVGERELFAAFVSAKSQCPF